MPFPKGRKIIYNIKLYIYIFCAVNCNESISKESELLSARLLLSRTRVSSIF